MGLWVIKALPLKRGRNFWNQFKSLLKSTLSEIFVSLSAALSTSSMRFKNGLEVRTHLVIYSNLPSRDCSCFLVHSDLLTHNSHSSSISLTLSGVMETVNFIVSISTPKHVTLVAGLSTFLSLMSKPRSTRRALRVSNEAWDLLTTEWPIMSSNNNKGLLKCKFSLK